jgi:hypothetical protein
VLTTVKCAVVRPRALMARQSVRLITNPPIVQQRLGRQLEERENRIYLRNNNLSDLLLDSTFPVKSLADPNCTAQPRSKLDLYTLLFALLFLNIAFLFLRSAGDFFHKTFFDISHLLGGITPLGVFPDAFPGLNNRVPLVPPDTELHKKSPLSLYVGLPPPGFEPLLLVQQTEVLPNQPYTSNFAGDN